MVSKLSSITFRVLSGIIDPLRFSLPSVQAQETKSKHPNIVLFFTDDQGYGDLSCYGADLLDTPNVDGMAANGIKFTDFYVTASVCSPSRASLMTGSYPPRVGFDFNNPSVLFPNDEKGLDPDTTPLPQALSDAGYATACIGKWHLGDKPEYMPNNQGFDYYFGLPYSNDMIPPRFPDLPLLRNDTVLELNPDQDYLTARYTEEAVNFIEKSKDSPFFLYFAHSMPHRPCHVSPPFAERFTEEQMASIDESDKTSRDFIYDAAIEEIDWSVGEVVKTLKKHDLDENTLIVFLSDNGPMVGRTGPLRGGKGTLWEGGVRIPCVMQWKGVIPPGTVCKEIATAMDFYPTFIKLAGGTAATHRKIDGHDILPLLRGEEDAVSPCEYFYYTFADKVQGVREGKWKLLGMHWENKALYDLETDIGEQMDVSAEHPEIVQRLSKIAEQFEKQLTVTHAE